MSDDGEKKTILGYVSAYLKRPLRSLSEVERKEAFNPPASATITPRADPDERRAARKSGPALHEMRRGKKKEAI